MCVFVCSLLGERNRNVSWAAASTMIGMFTSKKTRMPGIESHLCFQYSFLPMHLENSRWYHKHLFSWHPFRERRWSRLLDLFCRVLSWCRYLSSEPVSDTSRHLHLSQSQSKMDAERKAERKESRQARREGNRQRSEEHKKKKTSKTSLSWGYYHFTNQHNCFGSYFH